MSGVLKTPAMVACLGDSLTLSGTGVEYHSWPARLDINASLFPQCGVANYGKSGDQSSGFLTRYNAMIKGKGFSLLVILGCINDVTNDVAATASWVNIQAIVDDAIAAGIPVVLISTTPFGSSVDFTAGRQTQLLALRALFAAKAGVTHVDLYSLGGDPHAPTDLNPAWDYGDGKHYNATGGIAVANILAPILASFFPAPIQGPDTSPSTFGVTAESIRQHHFPQWTAFTANSNPRADTVTQKILECAGELESRLSQEFITASSIVDAASAAYLWCAKTLRLMTAMEVLTVGLQQAPAVSKDWKTDLDSRLKDLAEKAHLTLGTGTTAPVIQPDGPSHHLAQLGIDLGSVRQDASRGIPPFRRDDEQ